MFLLIAELLPFVLGWFFKLVSNRIAHKDEIQKLKYASKYETSKYVTRSEDPKSLSFMRYTRRILVISVLGAILIANLSPIAGYTTLIPVISETSWFFGLLSYTSTDLISTDDVYLNPDLFSLLELSFKFYLGIEAGKTNK